MMARIAVATSLAAFALFTSIAEAEPLEPPPESADGEDYSVEPADSLDRGSVEVNVGAWGRDGEGPRRTHRVRFREGTLGGAMREGRGDPLAGGEIEAGGGLGAFGFGRLAPRWGRGLVLGGASEPWSSRALDRGAGSAFRGRAGEGAWLRRMSSGDDGDVLGAEILCGRFARRGLAGVRLQRGRHALGVLTAGHRQTQVSLASRREAADLEIAIDPSGRWRSEVSGHCALRDWRLSVRTRGGASAFRSLAEPKRSGPSRALAVGASGDAGETRLEVMAAMWRFTPGHDGARAALEVERRLPHHGVFVAGLDEQHGTRREDREGSGLRQGWWAGWRGGGDPLELALRHENWGERAWARGTVRTATTAGIEARGPFGVRGRVAHCVYRTRRRESLYLAEMESDRLTLKALSGAGERTRFEVAVPAGGGSVQASLAIGTSASRSARAKALWTIHWTRRSRTGGS